jgi:hypothetical protein
MTGNQGSIRSLAVSRNTPIDSNHVRDILIIFLPLSTEEIKKVLCYTELSYWGQLLNDRTYNR